MGIGTVAEWHAPHALAQHRSEVRVDGRGWLAHLLRRPRSVPGRSPHRPHRRWRGDEVRVATLEYRIREAVRHRRREPKPYNVTGACPCEDQTHPVSMSVTRRT